MTDWDKENYFSVLNVRKRKFEKERVERQLQAEAERIRKEEIEAHQAALLRAEVERLKTEQLAAALRCVPFDLLDTAVERCSSLNFIAQHAHGTSPHLSMNFPKEVWLLCSFTV